MTQVTSLAMPTAVAVRVVYLARLRESLGLSGETLTLPGADVTVAAVVDALRSRGGPFARELAAGRAFRVAVNHALAAPDAVVRSGDEVAFLPPVTGG
jgi:molybdopterin synthase sulfur carrier subunit